MNLCTYITNNQENIKNPNSKAGIPKHAKAAYPSYSIK
jgi:hypothetical protein